VSNAVVRVRPKLHEQNLLWDGIIDAVSCVGGTNGPNESVVAPLPLIPTVCGEEPFSAVWFESLVFRAYRRIQNLLDSPISACVQGHGGRVSSRSGVSEVGAVPAQHFACPRAHMFEVALVNPPLLSHLRFAGASSYVKVFPWAG
jgi:hypothetical protein